MRRDHSLIWLLLAALLAGGDRWIKHWAELELSFAIPSPVIPGFFDLTLLYNKGAAFSFLAGQDGWQRWFFIAIAVVMSVVLVVWLYRTARKLWWLGLGLSLILGGALGNLYDRIVLGHVVDYLSFHFGSYSFPAFNLADCGITVGAALLIIDMLFFEKRRQPQES